MSRQLQTLQGEITIFTSPLDAVLDNLGIRVIPDDIVEAYKLKELDAAPPSDFVGRTLHRMGAGSNFIDIVIEMTQWVGCFCGGVIVFVIGLFLVALSLSGVGETIVTGTWFVFIGLIIFGVGVGIDMARVKIGQVIFNGPAYWATYPVSAQSSYILSLPAFVQSDMRRIKGALPDVRFVIADLQQNWFSLDPILYAILGEHARAIRVWKNDTEVVLLPKK